MATLAELRTDVLNNLDRGGAPATEVATVTDWLNQVIREDICAEHNWDFMEAVEDVSTVASQGEYSFPDSASGNLFKDCRMIRWRESSSDDFVELEEMSDRAIFQHFSEQTDGTPQAFARVGTNKFLLRPIPDAVTTLRCHTWEYPADLASDGATNALTLYYPRLIEYGTTARGFLYYGEYQAAQVWAQSFYQERERAIRNDRQRLAPNNRTLKLSTAAGRPAAGLRRGSRSRQTPYSWWS
tara:strand:- start:99 stop:821 length:723 start_codon:yes stop_codon:yes gene_type:complete